MARSDNFNRANSGSSMGTPSDGGSDWGYSGTWGINSNQGYNAGGDSAGYAWLLNDTGDCEVQATFATFGSDAGIFGRLSSPSDFIGVFAQTGTGYRLFKCVGGSFTQIGGTYAATPASSDIVKLTMNGTAIAVLVNGVSRITGTDGHNANALYCGLRAGSDSATRFEDFSVTAIGGGDTTAPVLSSPTASVTGSTTATVGATTDEGNGTQYVVVTTSVTQPSVAQIKAGQNDAGAAAVYAGNVAISITGAHTHAATGLTASTSYYAHFVHADAAGNNSNRVTTAQFTTNAPASGAPAASSSRPLRGRAHYGTRR